MTRYRLTIEYDGGPFVGWQRQAEGASVQGVVEAAIKGITGERVTLHAAGRTDAGVHALAMTAHVDIAKPMTPFRLVEGINAKLRPQPVAILGAGVVDDDFHARFSCIGRRYVYRITNRRHPLTIDRGRAWRVALPLDVEAMQAAARILVGRHDFTTFRSAHCQGGNPVRTLERLDVVREGPTLTVHAAARAFLHHQVRSMVGCLVLVGHGKWSVGDMKAALDARDRAALGFNAPPDGLYFVEALYPEPIPNSR